MLGSLPSRDGLGGGEGRFGISGWNRLAGRAGERERAAVERGLGANEVGLVKTADPEGPAEDTSGTCVLDEGATTLPSAGVASVGAGVCASVMDTEGGGGGATAVGYGAVGAACLVFGLATFGLDFSGKGLHSAKLSSGSG